MTPSRNPSQAPEASFAVGSGWLPIETAPKGATVDLWTEPYGRVTDAKWDAARGCWADWGIDGFGSPGHRRVEGRITHWMPLPAPPAPEPRP